MFLFKSVQSIFIFINIKKVCILVSIPSLLFILDIEEETNENNKCEENENTCGHELAKVGGEFW